MTRTGGTTLTETWRQALDGFSSPTPIPIARSPLGVGPRADERATSAALFPASTTEAIRTFAQQHDLDVETILSSAWALVLGRYSGETDVVFGVALSDSSEPLPLRISVDPAAVSLAWLLGARDLEARLRDRGDSTPADVRRSCQVPIDQPLFHSTFASGHTAGGHPQPLALVAIDSESIALTLSYDVESFEPDAVARMLGHTQALTIGLIANPTAAIGTLAIVTEPERTQLVTTWNATEKPFPRESCVHELIEAQVTRTPGSVALSFEGASLTYQQLDDKANQLAAHLVRLGVGPNVLVGIEIERSLEMVVGLLGILKAGGAYVPLDPEYPADRLAFVLADCKAPFLLTTRKLAAQLPPHQARVVCIDGDWNQGSRAPIEARRRRPSPDDLAYVIYTSGSTGKPKGVQLQHRGVVSFMTSMGETPGLVAEDRLLAVTTLSFDIAGLEIFLPLTVGAQVILAGRSVIGDGAQLRALLETSGATVLQATPVTWRLLIAAGWRGHGALKVLCGGEALTRELALQLLERSGSVWNLYGPTETTIWSSLCRVEAGAKSISIGRPIANTQMYILDAALHPTPIGVAGELFIGGVGVARGYLGRPELTAEKFLLDPFAQDPAARVYRTGDLARQQADGSFEHLGRLDFQVKIRGFRIELGEIEAALVAHPGIKEAVVVARESREEDGRASGAPFVAGSKRLVAYVIARTTAPTPGELRRFLRLTLSSAMVPSAFVVLDTFPLTPNQKVDRRALPAPAPSRPECEHELRAPRDLLEQQLVDAWEAALEICPIGIDDDVFLDLGADSLAAMECAAAIQSLLKTEVPAETLLQQRTVAAQATFLRSAEVAVTQPRLATLRTGRSRPDLFLVHSAGADAFAYLPLVRKTARADVTVHVLQNPYRFSGAGMYPSVEAMARDYVTVLRTQQPEGPYRLGGWSLGGSVAFEMANQLVAAGQEVAGLVLFDAYRSTRTQRVRRSLQRTFSRWRYKLVHRFPRLGLHIPGTRAKLAAWGALPPLARFYRLLRTLAFVEADDAPIFVERLFPGLFDTATLRGLKGDALWEHVYAGVKSGTQEQADLTFGMPGGSVASIRQRARVFAAEDRIELAYVPGWVYARSITLMNVRGSTTSGTAWAPFSRQPLEIHEFDVRATAALPFAHIAMMQDENVSLFAPEVVAFLDRTSRSLPGAPVTTSPSPRPTALASGPEIL